MTKTDLHNIVSAALKQYERTNNEIIGCFILFETDEKAPINGAFEWDTYQFDGEVFHNRQKFEIKALSP